MDSSETFRSRLAQGLAVLTALVAVAALVAFVGEEGPTALLSTLAPVALVVAAGWALLWNPRVELTAEGITIVNVWRTVRVPWRRFRHADTRWALSVTTDQDVTYTSWAVPAGSGFGARLVPQRQQHGEWAPAQRKLGSSGTAEAAAMAIADRVPRRPGADERSAEVTVTPNTRVLAVLGGLAVLAALSVTLG
ncbi:PH domain-containing protein [Pseudactinotalea suaedae]|uniref:PH domain-containing protein n=1 Tax=Pseudactinotalea suaedae TaxID=1524924 RepID=UPI0012E0FCE4|nr:PH domain-containing protein [Pseudactinotalea suaedae]